MSVWKRELSDTLKIPCDVAVGDMIVSVLGQRCVVIQNYRCILTYTDTVLKLQGKSCRLVIRGMDLCLVYYDEDEMKITGRIQSVEYER